MNEAILRKLQKLLALQDSASKIGSQAEAETVATKIQELLIQYNLDMNDVKNSLHQDKSEAMGKADIKWEDLTGRHESDWILQLYYAIAEHNLCKVIKRHGWNGNDKYSYLSLIGNKVNAEIVIYTVDQLVPRIRSMSRPAFKNYEDNGGETKKNTWIRGYLRGAVRGIEDKLKESIVTMQRNDVNIFALVRTNEIALKDAVEEHIGKIKMTNQSKLSGRDGFLNGRKDGKNMNIHKGLNNSEQTPILGKQPKQINKMSDNQFTPKPETTQFKKDFNVVNPQITSNLTDEQLEKWLESDEIKDIKDLNRKMDLFADKLLSQGEADVKE